MLHLLDFSVRISARHQHILRQDIISIFATLHQDENKNGKMVIARVIIIAGPFRKNSIDAEDVDSLGKGPNKISIFSQYG